MTIPKILQHSRNVIAMLIGKGRIMSQGFSGKVEGLEDIPRAVFSLKVRIRVLYRWWWATHYATGLLGVVAGTMLTAIGAANNPTGMLGWMREYIWLIGIVAAVSTSLVTFLGPIQKAERYWSAFHVLDQALIDYQLKEIDRAKLKEYLWHVRKILLATEYSSSDFDTSKKVKQTRQPGQEQSRKLPG